METKRTVKKLWIALFILAAFAWGGGARSAHAATLYFSPSSGTYASGQSFTVTVGVSSPDQAMNAAQGEISFPTSKLEVLSVSKKNSILNLWVQDPTFSNYDGTVNFSGVAVNPGFTGANGTVVAITFEAKNSGSVALTFASAAVLANDGKGTNVLTGTSGASFTIAPPAAAGGGGLVSSPAITITSNPSTAEDRWYDIRQIVFNWSLPSNIEGVDYTISNDPSPQFSYVNQGMITRASYDLSNFADGVWHFFVSFESGNAWSLPIEKTIMIDRTPPDPFIITRLDTTKTDSRPVFAWAATDQTSGIDHYQAKIGDGDWFDPSILENGSSSYVLPLQSPTAARTLTVRAFDKAGNYRDASIDFKILSPNELCAQDLLSCGFLQFFYVWSWAIAFVFIIFLLIIGGFIYYLLRWEKRTWEELTRFEEEFRKHHGIPSPTTSLLPTSVPKSSADGEMPNLPPGDQ